MESIRFANNSVSAVISGYGLAEIDGEATVIFLDIAPQHPKVVGAIWASLVNGTKEWLHLSDEHAEQALNVRGLNRRYHRLTIDAPRLAGRARPKHLRLVAPCACQIESLTQPFVVLAWHWRDDNGKACTLSPALSLAAMLERYTPLPILMAWGDYLLSEAETRGYATPILRGGDAPEGYLIEPAPWEDIITDGIAARHISLT
jgi:hypothetical protein